jgi:hypothetical protein
MVARSSGGVMSGAKGLLFAFLLLTFATPLVAQTAPARPDDGPPDIADNSFLVEEAYNQEFGVVQHIQSFTRFFDRQNYVYTFTQEWPIDLAPRNQFSYTIAGLDAGDSGSGFGIGDIALNYRYQVIQNDRFAFAPRVSVLLPTGDSGLGRGAGATGVQFNLPVSVTHSKRWVTHWNLGGTIIPNAKDPLGNRADVHGYSAGQSFIFKPHHRFNLMLETVFSSTESVVGPGQTQRENSWLLNPGFRWAYNLKNGMQIVPGVSVPTGIGPTSGEVGVLFYLSIEHPYRKLKK